jgi:hypothetical protein
MTMCIPLYLLYNNSEKTFPPQRRIVGGVICYAIRVVSEVFRLSVLSSLTLFFPLSTYLADVFISSRLYISTVYVKLRHKFNRRNVLNTWSKKMQISLALSTPNLTWRQCYSGMRNIVCRVLINGYSEFDSRPRSWFRLRHHVPAGYHFAPYPKGEGATSLLV